MTRTQRRLGRKAQLELDTLLAASTHPMDKFISPRLDTARRLSELRQCRQDYDAIAAAGQAPALQRIVEAVRFSGMKDMISR